MFKISNFITAFLIVFCTVNSCSAQQNIDKGSLFIIGGGSRSVDMVMRIATESGIDKGGYAVILPMSSEEPDTSVFYAKKQFTELGYKNVYGLQFEKGEKPNQAKTDSIRNARLVYISGGDQSRFMDVVTGTDIEKAIHDAYANGSMVAGTSAGAAVMSKVMITGNELKHPDYSSTFRNIEADNIETATGLGMLTTAIIDQHFVKRSRHNRLLSAVIEYPDMLSIGIDESTAILVKNGMAEVVGESQVLVFSNPKKSKVEKNGRLGARGLQLDIYLPGDTFEIK
ncbi:cyanophycinase [Cryomorpha ignava]|uniref:Cyanophycinase n=1 Tax=Cryomorpha ignava TaxID=101383 RepID=A0A7K3WNY0_9FLAO|nr:cyanophycinase [Cryomorpha ignava]NEN23204.1 cyanophycinase [Cryomorpha ignava]